mmetsp:Transcript_39578/g.114218  ORF Transcript_39578/g.114218 Transcript_39578/m.114218 type:complete len:416 (-) Transcript_39578:29-1276(-)
MHKVVIIGGGLAGKMTAEFLKKNKSPELSLTIITASHFQEWSLAGTYTLANPEKLHKFISPNPSTWQLPGVAYEFGIVEEVTDGLVKLAGGKAVPFDACVVATGFSLPLVVPKPGITHKERVDEVQAASEAIRKAQHILIAGGGAVGVELLGDLRETAPAGAKFTLVCATPTLLPHSDAKYQAKALRKLESWGVEVLFNEKVADEYGSPAPVLERRAHTLKSNKVIEADVYLPAFSQGPRTQFLRASASQLPQGGVLNGVGLVDVNDYLQAKAYPKLFAVGCSSKNEPAMVPKIEAQAKTTAANVKAFLDGKPLAEHKEAMPEANHPLLQVMGHNTYAFFEPDAMPGPMGRCVRCCGFPCCPCCPCWCCCPPMACGFCCGSPEGQGTAKLSSVMLTKFAGSNFKGMGEAPKQQTM